MIYFLLFYIVALSLFIKFFFLSGGGEGGFFVTLFGIGFLLLTGFVAGRIIEKIKVPRITAYIIVGIIFGPYVLGIVTHEQMSVLKEVDDLALTVIAFMAGGELNLKNLKGRIFSLFTISVLQTVIIYVLSVALFLVFTLKLPMFSHSSPVALAFLLGVLFVAKSPASTIAVIVESKSKGELTDTTMGIVVVKDIIVVLMFAFVFFTTKGIMKNTGFNASYLVSVILEIVGSIVAGLILAGLSILYFRYINKEHPLFALILTLVVVETSNFLHFHSPLIFAIATGFFIENFSKQGSKFIEGVEYVAMPVLLVFFSISGAKLDVTLLEKTWFLAIITFLLRILFIYISTYIPCRILKESEKVTKNLWTGLVSQAGVTLGFIAIIVSSFNGEVWAKSAESLIISMIILSQLLGPSIFKWGLIRAGEVSKR